MMPEDKGVWANVTNQHVFSCEVPRTALDNLLTPCKKNVSVVGDMCYISPGHANQIRVMRERSPVVKLAGGGVAYQRAVIQ